MDDLFLYQYGFFFTTLFFVSIITYFAYTDPRAGTYKTMAYIVSMVVALLIGFAIYIKYSTTTRMALLTNSAILVLLALFVVILVYILSATSGAENSDYWVYLEYVILAIIVVIILAIIFNTFSEYLRNLEGWSGIFVDLIFYIPCVVTDIIAFLLKEYKMTPNIIFVLFILEIVFILLYLYLPFVIKKIVEKNGIQLQSTPLFTDVKTDLSGNDNFKIKSTDARITDAYRRNYSISLWLYLNAQSQMTTETTEPVLFEYGFTDDNGNKYVKPMLTYRNSPDRHSDYVVIHFSSANDDGVPATNMVEINIPKQKWMNFVITYNNNIADIFVNGNLERSMKIINAPSIYDPLDKITIGQNNGALGAICNVVYYTVPLTRYQIVSTYNLLHGKNLPIS
jgi:hypothetical protein